MAGRMNWDRVRSETTLRDRGGEPSGLSSGRPARKPATADKQRAALARYRAEFEGLEYGDQLAYLGPLRRRLAALLGSDEKAVEAITKHFKSSLKKPKATGAPSTPKKSKAAPQRPHLSGEAQRAAVLDLIARRPGVLPQRICVSVLLGEPVEEKVLQLDPRYGCCSGVPKSELKGSVRHLVLSGSLLTNKRDGKLFTAKR